MSTSLSAGEDVLARLRKIAYANNLLGGDAPMSEPEPPKQAPANDARAVAAAAQAFADRAHARANGRAA